MNIEELERLAKRATPGPWKRNVNIYSDPGYCQIYTGAGPSHGSYWESGSEGKRISGEPKAEADAAFIAAANPAAILELVALVKKYEAALKFYAERSNWVTRSGKIGVTLIDIEDREPYDPFGYYPGAGGKRARDALGGRG